eukprot:6192687-Pleurochrysis_carterae.AAC.5
MGSFGVCSIVGSMLKGQIFAIAGARSIFAVGLRLDWWQLHASDRLNESIGDESLCVYCTPLSDASRYLVTEPLWAFDTFAAEASSAFQFQYLQSSPSRPASQIGLVTSLVVLPPAVSGWLGEARASAPERRCALADVLSPSHPGSGVFKLALVLSALALALAVTSVELEATPWVPPLLSLPVSALVCLACWRYERRVSADLAKASMYAFLQNAMQPSLVVMYKWCVGLNNAPLS